MLKIFVIFAGVLGSTAGSLGAMSVPATPLRVKSVAMVARSLSPKMPKKLIKVVEPAPHYMHYAVKAELHALVKAMDIKYSDELLNRILEDKNLAISIMMSNFSSGQHNEKFFSDIKKTIKEIVQRNNIGSVKEVTQVECKKKLAQKRELEKDDQEGIFLFEEDLVPAVGKGRLVRSAELSPIATLEIDDSYESDNSCALGNTSASSSDSVELVDSEAGSW